MKIIDLVNIDELRELCESFTALTGIVTAVVDLEGNIIIATGWQDICTHFHRANPLTACRCRESDTILASPLAEGENYIVYKCKNGLIDVAARITIGGEHVGNLYSGQFFFESPNKDFFISQAEDFGFDKNAYLDALDRVPIISDNYLRKMMGFFSRLAHLIGEMGLARMHLMVANIELKKHREQLEEEVTVRTAELRFANTQLQEEISERERAATERERLIGELQSALENVKILSGMLPICANCKKIRDDKGYWNQIESYISEHSEALFTHGLCPECAKKLYPNLLNRKK
jgi:ligand-binding sensor protein